MVKIDDRDFVIADLPGLIEGAHEGAGLGDRFLGHAERCGVILHLIDGTESAIVGAYRTIRGELKAYGHGLSGKPEILALNKIDSIPKAQIVKKKAALEKASGAKVFLMSGVSGEGVTGILRALAKEIAGRRTKEKKRATPARAWTP
jgi:GTP-binding protein